MTLSLEIKRGGLGTKRRAGAAMMTTSHARAGFKLRYVCCVPLVPTCRLIMLRRAAAVGQLCRIHGPDPAMAGWEPRTSVQRANKFRDASVLQSLPGWHRKRDIFHARALFNVERWRKTLVVMQCRLRSGTPTNRHQKEPPCLATDAARGNSKSPGCAIFA